MVTVMTWTSREVPDRGMVAVPEYPSAIETMDQDPVFDGSRVIW